MRLSLIVFFLSLTGFSFAQDTTFALSCATSVPEPIATPTLAFTSSTSDAYNGTELVPSQVASPTTALSSGFQDEVYWGERNSNQFMQPRISTPILTAEETAYYTYATANGVAASLELPPGSSVIVISSTQMPANLPPSIFDPGVSGIADPQSLGDRGYGVSLGAFAALLRAHRRAATHVFTNEDLHK